MGVCCSTLPPSSLLAISLRIFFFAFYTSQSLDEKLDHSQQWVYLSVYICIYHDTKKPSNQERNCCGVSIMSAPAWPSTYARDLSWPDLVDADLFRKGQTIQVKDYEFFKVRSGQVRSSIFPSFVYSFMCKWIGSFICVHACVGVCACVLVYANRRFISRGNLLCRWQSTTTINFVWFLVRPLMLFPMSTKRGADKFLDYPNVWRSNTLVVIVLSRWHDNRI